MEIETFNKYAKLLHRKKSLNNQLTDLKSKIISSNKPISEVGWIEITHGNGSKRFTILDNKEDVQVVTELIETLLQKELMEVINQMKEL